jgi:chemotaxis protein MotB
VAAARKKKQDSGPEGAPEWMVTFSDCMTLLLTFFVLLLSFAGFEEDTLEGLGSSFANAMPAVGTSFTSEQEAMLQRIQVVTRERIETGSDTPTTTQTEENNFLKQNQPRDFKNTRVFSAPSSRFFLGQTPALSGEGKQTLAQLQTFLLSMPSRVVISENGPDDENDLGLKRAWEALEFLSSRNGLDKSTFSITQSNMMVGQRPKQRVIEITLLQRDIYK